MIRSRLNRLQRLTNYQVQEEFCDSPDEREDLMIELIRSLGDTESADKLQHVINTHRKRIREWKFSLEEKREEMEAHRSFFVKCSCQVVNKELSTGSDAFLAKDFMKHRFWVIVDSCLVEIGLRKLRLGGESIEEARTKLAPTLEDRIASYTVTRPKLTFPTFSNLSDPEQRLVEDVLKDQRGLKRTPGAFSPSTMMEYDRRYVASLRAQLNAAEILAKERLQQIRKLESALSKVRPESAYEGDSWMETKAYSPRVRPILPITNERRRVAGELRDLAHELAKLPDRITDYIANERRNSASRARGASPRFIEDAILLSRGVSYDLTTLDLIDAGLCEVLESE